MDIGTILARVRETITTNTGLRAVGISDSPPVPCVSVYPDDPIGNGSSYYSAFNRGSFELDVVCHVLFPTTSMRSAEDALNAAISAAGATSIPQAIFLHPTLGTDPDENTAGNPSMTASLVEVREYATVSSGDGTRLLGAKVIVRVITEGDT